MGRPEEDSGRYNAMKQLGCGLSAAGHHERALSVREAELAMERRLGASEDSILATQSNLASTYSRLGRNEEALRLRRDVYFGVLKLYGEEHPDTLREANNYAVVLLSLERHAEAKPILYKAIPNARRTLGAEHDLTLNLRKFYGQFLYEDPSATRADVVEAIEIFEDVQRRARRVFGAGHPNWELLPHELTAARGKLASFDT